VARRLLRHNNLPRHTRLKMPSKPLRCDFDGHVTHLTTANASERKLVHAGLAAEREGAPGK
jgi:hypothetical protein